MKKKSRFIICLILLLVFGLALVRFYNNYTQINRLENKLESLEEEIELAEKENQDLKEDLNNIENEEYIEKTAREKLGLVKPGEMLIIPIVEEEHEGE